MIREELAQHAIPIGSITNHPRNVRQGDIGAISESLKDNGQYRPIVVQRSTGHVLAGNHTLKAAKALGWKEIAATFVDCDDDRALRILLADNRTNDLASYDDSALAELLKELAATEQGLNGTMFDGDDLDRILQDIANDTFHDDNNDQSDTDEDIKTLLDNTPSITKSGDVWLLGDHRVMCGDCRNENDVNQLIGDCKINMAFTSPPYAEQRKYDETSPFKPIPPDEYVEWFADVALNVKKHLADDGSWFVNIKPSADGIDTHLYVFDLVLAHVREWNWHFGTELCWERNGVPKKVTRRFRNGFEPVYQFVLGEWKMRPKNVRVPSNNVPMSLGEGDTGWKDRQGKIGVIPKNRIRQQKNSSSKRSADVQGSGVGGDGEYVVDGLAYPNNRLPTFIGSHQATGHTASFPIGLPAWFINAYTDEVDSIYDPFCGSGSTVIASNQENRIAFGMEISARYVDLICARYQNHTGITPVLEATGKAHNFITQ